MEAIGDLPKWLLEKVLVNDDKVFTIMVLPVGVGEPNYRGSVPE